MKKASLAIKITSIEHMITAIAHLEQAAALETKGVAANTILDLTSDIEHAIEDIELLRDREETNLFHSN